MFKILSPCNWVQSLEDDIVLVSCVCKKSQLNKFKNQLFPLHNNIFATFAVVLEVSLVNAIRSSTGCFKLATDTQLTFADAQWSVSSVRKGLLLRSSSNPTVLDERRRERSEGRRYEGGRKMRRTRWWR